jgi:hypothetical protein
VHFSERHRPDAPHGTGRVFDAATFARDDALDAHETDGAEAAARWGGGPDGWACTADVDPAVTRSKGELARHLEFSEINWSREPSDDARRPHAHATFIGPPEDFYHSPAIDRVETPRMIQLHESSVSVGHSVLIIAPFSALVAASGRRVTRIDPHGHGPESYA